MRDHEKWRVDALLRDLLNPLGKAAERNRMEPPGPVDLFLLNADQQSATVETE